MTIKSSHSLLLCAIKQAELLHIHQHEYKHATHFHSMHVTHKSSTPLQVYHLTVHVRRRCCCVPQTGNGQKALMIGLIHGRMWSRVFSIRFIHSEETVEQCHLCKRHTQKLWNLALPNRTQRKTWPARPWVRKGPIYLLISHTLQQSMLKTTNFLIDHGLVYLKDQFLISASN